jgi:hypothetical protein
VSGMRHGRRGRPGPAPLPRIPREAYDVSGLPVHQAGRIGFLILFVLVCMLITIGMLLALYARFTR